MDRLTELAPRIVDGYPPDLKHGELAVVEVEGRIKAFWFLCPCGCESPHWLPASPADDGRASWDLTREEDGTYSASPSVLRIGGCASHYFIRHNRIDWC